MQSKLIERKVAEDVSLSDLPGLAEVYAEARGPGLEVAHGFFDVFAQFEVTPEQPGLSAGSEVFVGFRLEFTGT